jgi:hypothetical protein
MRHGTSNRRSRSRNNRGKGNNGRAQVFDSNGPDVRIRGTAHQICEKYMTLAKDARSAGDAVLAESYLQHAEHYQRMIVMWDEQSSRKDSDNKPEKKVIQAENDDLSLPNSILGDKVKSDSESTRTAKPAMENA